jgi:uncharacterized protein YprB with RNaseH-like and TPR domain
MRLVDKLRRIAAPSAEPVASGSPGAPLPGELIETDAGAFRRRRIDLPLDRRHGRYTLSELAESGFHRLVSLSGDPALLGLDPRRCVFFDTETTSLGGGVGTYVFLFGAGWFDGDTFRVEQYFLDDVTGERALLNAINECFERFDNVVSFHGKGFDAPRLGGRLLFHRMRPRFPEKHLDLCVIGRKLFRGVYPNCRLQTFERELVGHARDDDLPGADCPRAFFDHLQGRSDLIPRVFEHNFLDVLTLPAVGAAFAAEVESPRHPVVLSNLGSFFESVGRDREARQAYRQALEGLRAAGHRVLGRTLERLALLERRAGRHGTSAELLLERIATRPAAFQPLEDLAKYYEHRARDPAAAEATVIDARSRLLTGKIELDPAARARCLRALDHRIARLHRLLGTDRATEPEQPGPFQSHP